ncbi:dynein regulatory complex subunit 4-like [Myripristis murdjan]|uniref:Dynein regulatory complex subunit 4 n=1 Tax=Myripristis murdjan TaxID=586833 RepID=A0A667XWX7_9TELE|nr:dynein regulatory complex subunit 4-like [Myripristis murdjan]
MPPKNKGTSKKSAKGKTPVVIDGVSTDEMSKEQLEEHITRLREELDREREERNYFQLERDKIHIFWEITKRQFEENKSELRNRDREIEEAEERHQVEIKVYKQKMKHLLCEHQNTISELKAEGVISTKLLESEHAGLQSELRKGMQALKVDTKDQELSNENAIKELNLKHDEELIKVTDSFKNQVREIEARYAKKMECLREQQENRRKTEISEIEDRMNSHITTLIKNHEKNVNDIREYHNDLKQKDLAVNKLLMEQITDMKTKQQQLESDMSKVMLENKSLAEPLQKAQREVAELQKQLTSYERDKALLASVKARLKVGEKDMKDLKWEHEVLQQTFNKVQLERDELYRKFTQAIQEVQERSGFKNVLLERKLGALTDTLEKKEAQLYAVLSASNMDQTALAGVTGKLEEVLDSKNVSIKDLQYEIARVCKAHNDLLRTYEAKLRAFGIPVEELDFKPLQSSLAGGTLGQGPAGLVSAPK